MATKRKTVKKSSRKKSTTKRKVLTRKKPAAKKSSKKKVTKKAPVRKNTVAKKKTKKESSAAKKKAPTGKKATTKSSSPKKSSSKGPALNFEKDRINLLLKEINLLEKDNHKLTQQISKAQTKQEVVQELKSYLALLKQTPQTTQRNLPNLGETQETMYEPELQRKEEELAQQVEKSQNKDKLISRLKSLLATSRKDPDPEYLPPQEEVGVAPGVPQSHEELREQPSQENEDEDVHIEVESQAPATQTVKQPVQEQEEYKPPQEEAHDEDYEEPRPPQVDVEQLVKERLAQIEKKEAEHKGQFQATSQRGVLTMEDAQEYSELLKKMVVEINKVFIGQEQAVEGVLLSILCDAHSLLEGVPGLAKTLLVETLGKVIDGTTFKRIQFLPDLLPSDIIGGQVFNPKTAEYTIYKGPIFANFVLCDEINRAPPKTHAAVMEAMQEKKINIENEEFKLDRPFFVLATQNPLENKGTYDLPEAVLDRFMFKVILDYPERKHELLIITENATTKNLKKTLKPVIDKKKLLEMQMKVKKAYISDKIREYILDVVEATRGINKNIEGYKFVKYGAGVRASIYLSLAAKARAVMQGRNYVLPDDVAYVAYNTLRHRVVMNYRGKAHNISSEKIIDEILTKVKAL